MIEEPLFARDEAIERYIEKRKKAYKGIKGARKKKATGKVSIRPIQSFITMIHLIPEAIYNDLLKEEE